MTFLPDNLKTYEECRDSLAALICGRGAQEKASTLISKPPISERLIQSIWAEKHLKADAIQTLTGKPVKVLNPGRWNEESGPDFISGEISIGNQILKGDVEIHIRASDWLRHKHDSNYEFNRCILHAFLTDDDGEKYDTLFNGIKIERLCLESFLEPDLETLRQIYSADDYNYREDAGVGKCSPIIRKLAPEFLHKFLDLAGDRRMEEKAERLRQQLAGESYDQVFYQALMTSMGYKGAKTLFFLLSKRTPIAELLDYSQGKSEEERILIIQSILLHVANLIPVSDESQVTPDDETLAYLNSLNRWWTEFSGYFSDRILPPTKRWFSHVRPVNFPTRRIAGISRLIGLLSRRGRIFDGFMSLFRNAAAQGLDNAGLRRFMKEMESLMLVAKDPFWSYRYNFTSARTGKPLTLIGADRARSILYNAVLPMALVKSRMDTDKALEEMLWRCIHDYPTLSENVITKFMRRRLFGDDDAARPFLFNERRQQALFKIFHDCCNSNETTCDECYLYRQCGEQI